MPYALGVDLGTTYSAAATADVDRVEIFQLGNRVSSIPSVVTLRDDGTILVGEAADRRSVTERSRTAREFKRRLGDPTPILLGGTPYGSEALTGRLLEAIVAQVAAERGGPPSVVVLTHPAGYGPYKIGYLEEAARLAGQPAVSFTTEPEAAAVHYSRSERVEVGDFIAVFDFGGGTVDIAVVRKTADGFELTGSPEGMQRFGGIDLDEAVFGHVSGTLGGLLGELDPEDPAAIAALAGLRIACREAKEALSDDTDVTIPVMLPNAHTEVRLTRAEFEDMIRPRLRETVGMLERVVRSVGVGFDGLSRVLLVGGSSRIPLVAETIRQATGRPVSVDAHPKHAVALGAAGLGIGLMAEGSEDDGSEEQPATVVQIEAQPPLEVEATPDPQHGGVAPVAAEAASSDEPGAEAEAEQPQDGVPRTPGPGVVTKAAATRRLPFGALTAAVIVLAAVVGGAWAVLRGDDGATPTTAGAVETSLPAPGSQPDPAPPEVSPPPTGETPPVAAIYMASYAMPDVDGEWGAWSAGGANPPEDVASDYYPLIGPYSSSEPETIGQHFDSMRDAGISAVVVPWPGPDSLEDRAMPHLLEAAAARGMSVMVAISGPEGLAPDDGLALLEHLRVTTLPAESQYRFDRPGLWGGDGDPRPVVFLDGLGGDPAPWQGVLDLVHEWPDAPAVIAMSADPAWVELGHFDGLTAEGPDFSWSDAIPEGAYYIPTIVPGRSATRVGDAVVVDREDGATYEAQWRSATGLRDPAIIVIESFNRWNAGTQVEPAAPPGDHPPGREYESYEPLPPTGYLDLTRAFVAPE